MAGVQGEGLAEQPAESQSGNGERCEPGQPSLDKYRASYPPSLLDELRGVIQEYAESKTLRLCRKGKLVTRPDGTFYRVACGSKWSCPTCSPLRLSYDQIRIEKVLHKVPTVLYVTFTVGGLEGLSTKVALQRVLMTWVAAFGTGSWMPDFRGRTGMVGWVRSVETTFSTTSSHPHIHALFLFDSQPDQAAADAVVTRWQAVAARQGLRATRSAQDARYVASGAARARVAAYLCDQNAIREGSGRKGRTPGDLLHRIASTGDADDLAVLISFHRAVAGRRKISTSRGFWALAE